MNISMFNHIKKMMLIAQSCPILCKPMDYNLSGSSVHEILQARIRKWVAIPFSSGSSWPREWTQVSCITSRIFTVWVTREDPKENICMAKKRKCYKLYSIDAEFIWNSLLLLTEYKLKLDWKSLFLQALMNIF